MRVLAPAMHRTILAVDVEGFGDRRRTNPHQLAVRQALYQALHRAFTRSRVGWDDCYHEDRGDGVLVLIPPSIPKYLLVTCVPEELAAALSEHNRTRAAEASVRLRCAVHAGEVHRDDHGVAGAAVNLTFRLLEAAPLKSTLAQSPGGLALIVSEWFFEDVLRHDPAGEPARYRRVHVSVKETQTTAWIGLPGNPYPPLQQNGPRQLPNAVAGFVGRASELEKLTGMLDRPGDPVVVISAVTGTAGVGKTALAVQWAHQVRDWYPDGQLYVNLRGYDPGPAVTPGQALDAFLRALDVPDDRRPSEVDSQAAMFRSMLDGKRVLILLDNASSAEQVRPLLPGSAGCLVVVTSRSRLSGLVARDGASRISLDVLPLADAVALLTRTLGTERGDAEPRAMLQLARLCACLPLALRVAGERAVARAHTTLADLVDELTDERGRLDVLTAADDETAAVRSVFSWSYRHLPLEAARMFRLLGLHAGPDIGVPAAAALAAVSHAQTRRLLDTLTDVHLLEESGRGRFRFHDLLRVFAAERVEPGDDPDAAVRRILAWYTHSASAADRVCIVPHQSPALEPPGPHCVPLVFATQADALQWYDTEYANLLAVARQAAECGEHATAWKLPVLMWTYFYIRKRWSDWISTHRTGLVAAERVHDQSAKGWLLMKLGLAYRDMRRFETALDHLRQAMAIWLQVGFRWGEGMCLHNIGKANLGLGRFEQAIGELRQCLALCREIGEPSGEGLVLGSLGEAHRRLGRLTEALEYVRQALAAFRQINGENRFGEALALHDLALVLLELGRHDEAFDCYEQSLRICREIEDRQGEAQTLYGLGDALYSQGRVVAAQASWYHALAIFEDLSDPQAVDVRARLTTYERGNGRWLSRSST